MERDELISKILIATDCSDPSMRAAEFALRLAKHFSAEVVAISVIDRLILEEISKTHDFVALEEELKNKARRCLNYIVNSAVKEGLKASLILVEGDPFAQIVHHAESLKTDMIVMGTRGRRGTDRILIGSIAERVIEYAPCPVLVLG